MNLEDRLRETLRIEAERSSQTPQLEPVGAGRTNLRAPMAVAGFLVVLTIGVVLGLLSNPGEPPPVGTDSTIGPPVTTVPPSTTGPTVPATTIPMLPLEPTFIPPRVVENGIVRMRVEFPEGSWADLEWPEDKLDRLMGGVWLDGGGAAIPFRGASDFLIRRGRVDDVVVQFGIRQVVEEAPDGRGGTVKRWQGSGGVDHWAFQFGDWVVLVHTQIGATAAWAPLLRGETTESGFLRLYADEPLRLFAAPAYSAPYIVKLSGGVELIPGECDPDEAWYNIGSGREAVWCDRSGLLRIDVSGTPEYQLEVFEHLMVRDVYVAGVSGPDSNGSFAHLSDSLENARQRWTEIGPSSYRLTLSHWPALREVVVDVRDGVPHVVSGSATGALTVEDLFDDIEQAILGGAPYVEARFHEMYAHPTRITISVGVIDGTVGVTARVDVVDD